MGDFTKTTVFSLVDDLTGDVFLKNLDFNASGMEKSAASIDPELQEFIDSIKKKPGKSYLLINAMGASDYFGPNLNADYFYEETLKNHHKTFEAYGHSFRNHKNNDPKIANGKVLFSHYNNKMHRVEIVVEVADAEVNDILQQLGHGKTVATSMACKVSHDICSICGHKAKKVEDYCIHLKKFKNRIHTRSNPIPGATTYGQKVYAINPDPKFFDISFVYIPADSQSAVMKKVASILSKESTISKKVVSEVTGLEDLPNGDRTLDPKKVYIIQKTHGRLPKEDMKKLASNYSMPQIMSHMMAMNMFPGKEDFQYMSLTSDGFNKEAEYLYDNNYVFSTKDLSPDYTVNLKCNSLRYSDSLSSSLEKYANLIGVGTPLVSSRVQTADFEKIAEQASTEKQVSAIPYFAGMGGAYLGYNKLLQGIHKNWAARKLFLFDKAPFESYQISKWMVNNPTKFLLGLLGAGVATDALMQKEKEKRENSMFEKTSAWADPALLSLGITIPSGVYISNRLRDKRQQGEQLAPVQHFIADNPGTLIAGSALAGIPVAKKLLKISALVYTNAMEFIEDSEKFEKQLEKDLTLK